MWNQLIAAENERIKFNPPLSEEWIDKGLAELEVIINPELKSLLLETDGLYDSKQFLWIIWNVRDLSVYNMAMRNDKKFADKGYKFDNIFFISNSGKAGILFGFPIVNNMLSDFMILWFPENNKRIVLYYNLKTYIAIWSKYSKSGDFDNIKFDIY